jgi:hypothetical protein
MRFFQSLNHVDFYLKPQFLIKSIYDIVPSPSTALSADFPMIFALEQEIYYVANVRNIFRSHYNNNKQNKKVVEAKWGW